MKPYRQGDILLVPSPDDAAKSDVFTTSRVVKRDPGEGIIVASGEQSGHHHRSREPKARLIRKGNKLFLRAPRGGAVLTHEEHDAITLPPGTYEVVRQREYVPPERSSRSAARSRSVFD